MTYPIDDTKINSRWIKGLTVNNKNLTRKLKRPYAHSNVGEELKTLKTQKLVGRYGQLKDIYSCKDF